MVDLLLDAGADPNLRNDSGRTALHEAASKGDAAVLARLLARKADPRIRDDKGRTPLHSASNEVVARMLLDAGAEAEARDDRGRTPLHGAGNVALIRVLLDAGADLEAGDDRRQTPLHRAAVERSNAAVIRSLVAAGADLAATDRNGRIPLVLAATHNENADVVSALFAATAATGVGPNAGVAGRSTLLHFAALGNNSTDVLSWLLSTGADPNATDDRGRTALHILATKRRLGSAGALESLVTFGLAPVLRTLDERSSRSRTFANVSLLLKAGADPNARDANGQTPLHASAQAGDYARTIELLLDAGAEPQLADNAGHRPVDYAKAREELRDSDVYRRLAKPE